MVLVAVAGGTSPTLGRSIVEAILATNKHEVIILSRVRSGSGTAEAQPSSVFGANVVSVDYSSVDSLTTALRGVHTLISVLKLTKPGAMLQVHTTLLEACRSNAVARFVMSDWSMSPISHSRVDVLAHKADLLRLCEEENNRPNSHTACGTIQVGMFMNYFAQNCPTPDEELTAGLTDDFMLKYIDIANGQLLIPLIEHTDTPAPVSMTHIGDIGTLVALSLDLHPSQTRGALGLVSQTTTFAHIHQVLTSKCNLNLPLTTVTKAKCDAQASAAETRFQQSLEEGGFDLDAFMERMVAQMMAVQCTADEAVVVTPLLNRLLDQAGLVVPPTWTVEDLLFRAWGH